MNIGAICRGFRIKHKLSLRDIDSDSPKTLSAFEMGRSSNLEHIKKYVNKAEQLQDTEFYNILIKGFING